MLPLFPGKSKVNLCVCDLARNCAIASLTLNGGFSHHLTLLAMLEPVVPRVRPTPNCLARSGEAPQVARLVAARKRRRWLAAQLRKDADDAQPQP